ncbi:MAG TPA: hypothetical protein PK079_13750 [Leptospiraceae bacterium]|nr:hypothetical protein [Leptospiraceae bacterium]HMW07537.1 hypothetical protein [Leptospiraceae bacterium]HMX33285.1 hypothetical protein [Leptospiraceae bacterium]HMY33162.1 hypothetical protein [Leptospiraceae bacterium]HMZ67544.1 hypothetical protein [Leptospiraceae bacterium]
MADIEITNPNTIQEIVYESGRFKYILSEIYNLKISAIQSIRLDSDNFKIDINTKDTYYRFKPKGFEDVLMTNPETRSMELKFDPALAQAVYRILNDCMYEEVKQD